ncbi:restriction endonuclease subunit S [Staphylococcus sp. GDY8P100P]|uniref:restriction endonuclease subunit S n=1 Tax=Staphylococcus sp. GDY8P100P TaxID=2804429 RepID=UPI001951ADF3|nr:restriction endonuclease subunit S [Staphylococcus sp. GDY8P100P]
MEYKLGKVSTFYDSLHKTPKNYNIYGYPMVRVKDISTGFLDLSSCLNVSEDDYLEFSKKYKPQSGDIIITRVGTYGNIALVTKDKRFCLGQNTVILNVDKKIIDNKYLFYYLTSSMGQQQIESKVTGSTQKTISLKSLKEINIIRHDYYKEKQIGNLLYKIDNKINNNKQIVANLEELSQTLFKRWFVDFEFPDENGNPYKSSGGKMFDSELGKIPKNWGTSTVKNMSTKVISGGTPNRKIEDYWINGDIPWLKTKEIDNNIILKTEEYITEEGLLKSSAKFIEENSTVIAMYGATAGKIGYVAKTMTTNQACCAIESDYPVFIYKYFKYNSDYIKTLASGSAQQNLNKKILEDLCIIDPDKKVLLLFEEILNSTIKIMKEKLKENYKLVLLRDTLLPKLMSGEIEIPDDIEVNEDELSI